MWGWIITGVLAVIVVALLIYFGHAMWQFTFRG